MKTNRLITACMALLLLASCDSELKEKAELNVTVTPSEGVTFEGETVVVKKGTAVNFQFDGEPDFITFFSGESGKTYLHRERTLIDPAEIVNSEFGFSVWPQYGNKECTENTMRILISEEFGGLITNDFVADSVNVEKHNWKELIPQGDLPKAPLAAGTAVPFKVDFLPYLGKKVTLAFVYKTTKNSAAMPTWNFLNMAITNTFENGEKAQLMPSSFGLTPVNMVHKILPTAASIKNPAYATVTNNTNGFWNLVDAGKGGFKMLGAGAGYKVFLYNWLVSKAIVTNACSPDAGTGIKNIYSRLSVYSHTYDKVGTYTATFEANNANYVASSSVVRNLTIKVVD